MSEKMKSVTVNHVLANSPENFVNVRHVTLIYDPHAPGTVTLLGILPHMSDIEVTQELIDFLQAVLDGED